MLIQITNTCRMGCSHCMERSSEEAAHMRMDTVDMAVEFAKRSNAHVILLSGGEPTEHPLFKDIVKKFLEFPMVTIISNGMWIEDKEKTQDMQRIMDQPNVGLQITNYPSYYPHQVDTEKIQQLFPDAAICTDETFLNLLSLGRVRDSEELLKKAAQTPYTTACFSSALTAAQLPYPMAVQNMEMRGKFCRPMVDWRGFLHWSESWLCPPFASLQDDFDTICRKAHTWRPCLMCPDAEKLLRDSRPQYIMARKIMGL